MFKKTLATLLMSLTLVISSSTYATENLEQHMKVLEKNFKAFKGAGNKESALEALNNMHAAAVEAQKIKLVAKGDTVESSTPVYDLLLAEIDKTKVLVETGDLQQAKLEAEKIAAIRDQGHQLYKNH